MSTPSLQQSSNLQALLTEHRMHSGRILDDEAQPACVQVILPFQVLSSGAVDAQGDKG